ncbi:DUF4397 domain-containing protein [Streptomyces resistomycificus]|uniref:DUF4397 domain-containing protein n=1 Tax=Streptomyces resistomycificus TaxID=67356 RepID=A0A0L8L925_9ACTN|nr:DUF4397 domain-containing protein [Streptomyces resistomycificus]KOG34586.1 hypothetical protein ADK37_18890 [Streptomyces resistomycificus]KUO00796.1 hypothetical protein AQJ84_07340 [Streptomyces resistomycificus]
MRKSRTTAVIAACVGVGALSLGSAVPAGAAQADDPVMLSVFHAVPGLTVDVYANGDELLPDFEPGTLTDPQELPAGSYDLKVFKAGADPRTADPAIQKTVAVPAGANATVVAHLSADGKPQLDAFVNDTSAVAAGKSRLTVRHVAAAPAVDVRANGTAVFKELVNPKEDTTEVEAGTVSADVVLAGTDTVAIGPAELNLEEGTNNIVYAWGSADDKNLALKVQTISGMHSPPRGVDAGGDGAMASANSSDAWMAWAAGAGVLALAGALAIRSRARRDA